MIPIVSISYLWLSVTGCHIVTFRLHAYCDCLQKDSDLLLSQESNNYGVRANGNNRRLF